MKLTYIQFDQTSRDNDWYVDWYIEMMPYMGPKWIEENNPWGTKLAIQEDERYEPGREKSTG